MPKLVPIIGLEIHVELKTKSKMFCSCANDPFATAPNTHICEICLAHPGTLPVPNRQAIADTIKIALALNCEISPHSKFDRKHYFYPDLPKGYQISQYDQPIGLDGKVQLEFLQKNHRDNALIGVTRVHLEEDTAQLSHDSTGNTLVNFNRAGVPLVEIVSEPDIQSGIEAKAYCQELQSIFRYLGVSNADMEKGQMRCEANISMQTEDTFEKANGAMIAKPGHKLNSKVEVKNINSFKAVEKAIDFEIKRQSEMIAKGEAWKQETRGWDDAKGTVHQRFKETSADYRYFPEPDIPPFEPMAIVNGEIHLPELPAAIRTRFHSEYGFSYADADMLTTDKNWAEYTENVMSELKEWLNSLPESHACFTKSPDRKAAICLSSTEMAKLAGGWLTTKLMGAMNERKIDIRILKIKPENFAELVALIYTNRVNSTNAQKILIEMLEAGVDIDPTHIMEEKGYGLVNDEGKLGVVVDEVIKSNPKQVEQFKAGKEPILQFLKGMVMKATEGSADPVVAEKLLREKLKN